MKESYIADFTPGQSVQTTFLLVAKERKIASSGSAYLDLTLQDSTGAIRAKLWDSDHQHVDFEADDIVRVTATVEEYQRALQLKLRKIVRAGAAGTELVDYLPHSAEDPEVLFAAVLERARRMPPGPLRTLVLATLEDPAIANKYKLAPAATAFHHAYLGGLVEHVKSLLGLCDKMCDHYPEMDRNMVVAGLLLHDLGKIEELEFNRAFRYTTRGKLVGHITLGLGILREKVRSIPDFPPPLWDRLEHIILSHHGQLDFGSPKEPCFPEALLVHYLDDIDSKIASMRAQYTAERNQAGEWTTRNRALGRELLKPSSEPEAALTTGNHDANQT